MEKVTKILKHPIFVQELEKIELWETQRQFCKHDLDHFFAVARIAYILALEREIQMDKEIFYAFGLLHDIGRAGEYSHKKKHEIESAILAEQILKDCGFSNNDMYIITSAIRNHRDRQFSKRNKGSELMVIGQKADQLSRKCFRCAAIDSCKWSNDKKNVGNIIV